MRAKIISVVLIVLSTLILGLGAMNDGYSCILIPK